MTAHDPVAKGKTDQAVCQLPFGAWRIVPAAGCAEAGVDELPS
jgi:hypothetical protein